MREDFSPGDLLSHRHNPELGPGKVVRIAANRVVVEFPDSDSVLSFAIDSGALVPLVLQSGRRARVEATGETVTIEGPGEAGQWRLTDGRTMALDDIWPLPVEESPVQRLARRTIDSGEDFANRLDALRLQRLRQADGLGSFLGGRIKLYPHQLHAAESACQSDPVRWLLADGVGLGKTVEACLIMNRLIHTGRAERILVVVPEALTVQWLGELWRKHHQVFGLLDEERIRDVARDQGLEYNPFEVHRRAIIALEALSSDPGLVAKAVQVGIDLLVVDEAHHLQRPPGHPGNPAYRAVAAIAAQGRGMLLLTATPLENDAHGFLRLVQLLRPQEVPADGVLTERLEKRQSLPWCTSATRSADIGGWPARVGVVAEMPDAESNQGWQALQRLEEHMRSRPAGNAVAQARKADLVLRALASAAALEPVLKSADSEATRLLAAASDGDPRLAWLVAKAPEWRLAGDKTLIFVAHRETLEHIRDHLGRTAHLRTGVFHEDLSTARRDLEVARFRQPDGPSLLVSTECGGEGRNFEFCRRLVLFDLPWRPAIVEQRIGRLDRIGRTRPTEIVYFRPPGGLGRALVELFESLAIFSESVGSLGRELELVASAVKRVAISECAEIDPGLFSAVLEQAQTARSRIREAAYSELHRNPYRSAMASSILARVPSDLETVTADLVLRSAARFGFEVEEQSGKNTWHIELGGESLIDSLPGVPAGSRYLGSFDREEAVANEAIDFFASGHPLVEGILDELAGGPRGRTAFLQIPGQEDLFGLLAIYVSGCDFTAVAVDSAGQERPEIASRLIAPGLETEHVNSRTWTAIPGWKKAIRRIAESLPADQVPVAVAAWRIRCPTT